MYINGQKQELFDKEQSDLGLHCLPRPACRKSTSNQAILHLEMHFWLTVLWWRKGRVRRCWGQNKALKSPHLNVEVKTRHLKAPT